MSIISQLWTAVTGDGAEKANDTDNAYSSAASPLPPNPFPRDLPATSRHSPEAAIDLTSPPQSPRDSEQRRARAGRPVARNRRSADEKRLFGDYDIPADSVSAPHPASYFQSPRPAMGNGKPVSSHEFRPTNTLNRPNGAPSPAKAIRYGKSSRQGLTIGQGLGPGQEAFLKFHGAQNPSTPTQNTPSRVKQSVRLPTSSPTKQRKTKQLPPDVIDLEEDDVEEISSQPTPTTPAVRQHDAPRSSHSSIARHSVGSGPMAGGRPLGPRLTNEFLGVEKRITATRGVKKTTTRQQQSGVQDTSIYIDGDEETLDTAGFARKSILQNFQQGLASEHEPDDTTTSRHFRNARINESTSEVNDQVSDRRRASGNSDNLREFRRAGEPVYEETISEDELGFNSHKMSQARPRHSKGLAKKTQPANSGARRKSRVEDSPRGWPLIYARSHDFDSNEIPGCTTNEGFLRLRPGIEPKTWQIITYDASSKILDVQADIVPGAVVQVWADDAGRIRLQGPRRQDGNSSIFDLEFQNTEAFLQFRDTHVMDLLGRSRPLIKEQTYMVTLFSKPLPNNVKVGKTPLIDHLTSAAENEDLARARSTKTQIWNQRKATLQTHGLTASIKEQSQPSAAAQTQASTRPSRSTRATAPTHDVSDDDHNKEVEKYSVDTGLGPPWVKPLTYGEGRQKATVYFNDLWRLDEEEFMNDSLIDFYMIYLFKQSTIPLDNVFFFNTFFYSKLTQNTGREYINYEAVRRWTSRIDLFDYDYIVVPINEDTHWYLAVICNVSNIKRKAIEEDFDKSVVSEVGAGGNTPGKPAELVETNISSDPPVGSGSNVSSPSKHSVPEHIGTEVNLFDEESNLDLVDRERTGNAQEEDEVVVNELSVPQSPEADITHVVESIFDEPVVPKTVLSNLNASPEKKRKPKRRFMAPKKDPTQPVIIILDSLGQTRTPTVRALKDWLAAEGKARRGMEALIKEKGFYPKSDQIPTQNNFTDCGVYLLGYAEKFFQNPDEFKRKLLTGEMTAAEDWPQLKPKEMRNNLREIIFALAQEQKLSEDNKKKVKKGAVISKSSPARPDASISKPGSMSKEPESAEPKETEKMVVDAASAKPDSTVPSAQQLREPTIPRLGSPFSPKMVVESRVPGAEPLVRSGEISAFCPGAMLLDKDTVASPRSHQTLGKLSRPDVRIPTHKPSKETASKSLSVSTSPLYEIKSVPQIDTGTGSASPLKRPRPLPDMGDMEEPAKKKATPDIVLAEQENCLDASSRPTRSREGQSNHPIEIMDSQESKSKPTVRQSPRRNKHGSAAQRKRISSSPCVSQRLDRAPSLEEISTFPPQVVQSKHGQFDVKSTDWQLEAKLDADDAQRKKDRRGKRWTIAEVLEQEQRGEPDVMELDSQGTDPMDTADDVVGETPEPRRISPAPDGPWITGQPLSH